MADNVEATLNITLAFSKAREYCETALLLKASYLIVVVNNYYYYYAK
jgi:hypothetical protein